VQRSLNAVLMIIISVLGSVISISARLPFQRIHSFNAAAISETQRAMQKGFSHSSNSDRCHFEVSQTSVGFDRSAPLLELQLHFYHHGKRALFV